MGKAFWAALWIQHHSTSRDSVQLFGSGEHALQCCFLAGLRVRTYRMAKAWGRGHSCALPARVVGGFWALESCLRAMGRPVGGVSGRWFCPFLSPKLSIPGKAEQSCWHASMQVSVLAALGHVFLLITMHGDLSLYHWDKGPW